MSHALDAHAVRMRRERGEIPYIGSQHDTVGLGERHDQRIHGRPAPRSRSKRGRSAREREGDAIDDLARAEEPMRLRVSMRFPSERLHEDHGRNAREDAVRSQRLEKCERPGRALGERGDCAAVEDDAVERDGSGSLRHAARRERRGLRARGPVKTRSAQAAARFLASFDGSPTSSLSSVR